LLFLPLLTEENIPRFLVKDIPNRIIDIPYGFSSVLWGIKFRQPLFNAAGMFKTGDGYKLAVAQGAGAFLAGTSTQNSRKGNIKMGSVILL